MAEPIKKSDISHEGIFDGIIEIAKKYKKLLSDYSDEIKKERDKNLIEESNKLFEKNQRLKSLTVCEIKEAPSIEFKINDEKANVKEQSKGIYIIEVPKDLEVFTSSSNIINEHIVKNAITDLKLTKKKRKKSKKQNK